MTESHLFRFKTKDPELEARILAFMEKSGLNESTVCRDLIRKGFILMDGREKGIKEVYEIMNKYSLDWKDIQEGLPKK